MNNKKLPGHSITINASTDNITSQITYKDYTIAKSGYDDNKSKLQCMHCDKGMVFGDNECADLALLYFLSTLKQECDGATAYQWVGYDTTRDSI